MAHFSSDSGGIQPHNQEAARVKQLLPLYLRETAATSEDASTDVSLIALLEDYYKYLNSQGMVTKLSVVDGALHYDEALDSPTLKDTLTTTGSGTDLTICVESSTDSPSVPGRVVNVIPKNPGLNYKAGDLIYHYNSPSAAKATFKVEETTAGPTHVIDSVIAEHDLDFISDEFINKFQNEIAKITPKSSALNKKSLYKKILKYYKTRGSEESIKTFFKIFFNTDIQIFYPGEYTLKSSSATFNNSPSTVIGKVDLDEAGAIIVDSPNISANVTLSGFDTGFNVNSVIKVRNSIANQAGIDSFSGAYELNENLGYGATFDANQVNGIRAVAQEAYLYKDDSINDKPSWQLERAEGAKWSLRYDNTAGDPHWALGWSTGNLSVKFTNMGGIFAGHNNKEIPYIGVHNGRPSYLLRIDGNEPEEYISIGFAYFDGGSFPYSDGASGLAWYGYFEEGYITNVDPILGNDSSTAGGMNVTGVFATSGGDASNTFPNVTWTKTTGGELDVSTITVFDKIYRTYPGSIDTDSNFPTTDIDNWYTVAGAYSNALSKFGYGIFSTSLTSRSTWASFANSNGGVLELLQFEDSAVDGEYVLTDVDTFTQQVPNTAYNTSGSRNITANTISKVDDRWVIKGLPPAQQINKFTWDVTSAGYEFLSGVYEADVTDSYRGGRDPISGRYKKWVQTTFPKTPAGEGDTVETITEASRGKIQIWNSNIETAVYENFGQELGQGLYVESYGGQNLEYSYQLYYDMPIYEEFSNPASTGTTRDPWDFLGFGTFSFPDITLQEQFIDSVDPSTSTLSQLSLVIFKGGINNSPTTTVLSNYSISRVAASTLNELIDSSIQTDNYSPAVYVPTQQRYQMFGNSPMLNAHLYINDEVGMESTVINTNQSLGLRHIVFDNSPGKPTVNTKAENYHYFLDDFSPELNGTYRFEKQYDALKFTMDLSSPNATADFLDRLHGDNNNGTVEYDSPWNKFAFQPIVAGLKSHITNATEFTLYRREDFDMSPKSNFREVYRSDEINFSPDGVGYIYKFTRGEPSEHSVLGISRIPDIRSLITDTSETATGVKMRTVFAPSPLNALKTESMTRSEPNQGLYTWSGTYNLTEWSHVSDGSQNPDGLEPYFAAAADAHFESGNVQDLSLRNYPGKGGTRIQNHLTTYKLADYNETIFKREKPRSDIAHNAFEVYRSTGNINDIKLPSVYKDLSKQVTNSASLTAAAAAFIKDAPDSGGYYSKFTSHDVFERITVRMSALDDIRDVILTDDKKEFNDDILNVGDYSPLYEIQVQQGDFHPNEDVNARENIHRAGTHFTSPSGLATTDSDDNRNCLPVRPNFGKGDCNLRFNGFPTRVGLYSDNMRFYESNVDGTNSRVIIDSQDDTKSGVEQTALPRGAGVYFAHLKPNKVYWSNQPLNLSLAETAPDSPFDPPQQAMSLMPFSKAGKRFGTATVYEGNLRMYVHALDSCRVRYFDNRGAYDSPAAAAEAQESPAADLAKQNSPDEDVFLRAGESHIFRSRHTTDYSEYTNDDEEINGQIINTEGRPVTGIIFSTGNVICSTATHIGTDDSPHGIKGTEVLTPMDTNLVFKRASNTLGVSGRLVNTNTSFGQDQNSSPHINIVYDVCSHPGTIDINGQFKNVDGQPLDMTFASPDFEAAALDMSGNTAEEDDMTIGSPATNVQRNVNGWSFGPDANASGDSPLGLVIKDGHAQWIGGDSHPCILRSSKANLVSGQQYTLTYTISDVTDITVEKTIDLIHNHATDDTAESKTEIPVLEGTHTTTFTAGFDKSLIFRNRGTQRFQLSDLHLKGSSIITSIKGFGALNDSPNGPFNTNGEGFIVAAEGTSEIFAAALNDGDGKDTAGGISRRQMSDTYVFANELTDYSIITPYNNSIDVKYMPFDNSPVSETTYTSHTISGTFSSPGFTTQPESDIAGRFNGTIGNWNVGYTPDQVNIIEFKGRILGDKDSSPDFDENTKSNVGDFNIARGNFGSTSSLTGGDSVRMYLTSDLQPAMYNGTTNSDGEHPKTLFNRAGDAYLYSPMGGSYITESSESPKVDVILRQSTIDGEIPVSNRRVCTIRMDYSNNNHPLMFFNDVLTAHSSPESMAFSPALATANGGNHGGVADRNFFLGNKVTNRTHVPYGGEFYHFKGWKVPESASPLAHTHNDDYLVFDIRYRDGGLYDIKNDSPLVPYYKKTDNSRLFPLHGTDSTNGHLTNGGYTPKLWKFTGRRPFALILNSSTNELVLEGHQRNTYNVNKLGDLPDNTWSNQSTTGAKDSLSNENFKLQDMDFYQDYSYEIRSKIPSNDYADAFQKFAHPAGLKYFTKQVDSPDTNP